MFRMKQLSGMILIAALFIMIWSCEKAGPLQTSEEAIDKPANTGYAVDYPVFKSYTLGYWEAEDGYYGGSFSLIRGNEIHVEDLSLTPPDGTVAGADVTLTTEVERTADKKQLLYTFGPEGSTFDPPLTIKLDWERFGMEDANLYFINEDGNYILQDEEDVEYDGKWMNVSIHHFSRYAIAVD